MNASTSSPLCLATCHCSTHSGGQTLCSSRHDYLKAWTSVSLLSSLHNSPPSSPHTTIFTAIHHFVFSAICIIIVLIYMYTIAMHMLVHVVSNDRGLDITRTLTKPHLPSGSTTSRLIPPWSLLIWPCTHAPLLATCYEQDCLSCTHTHVQRWISFNQSLNMNKVNLA